jgi:hypothetical protein
LDTDAVHHPAAGQVCHIASSKNKVTIAHRHQEFTADRFHHVIGANNTRAITIYNKVKKRKTGL